MIHLLGIYFVDVSKVLVGSSEDTTDQSLSIVRLSSYLSTSTEGSDQPPTIGPVPEGATTMPDPKAKKDSGFGFPDIPFGSEPDEDVVLEPSGPPAKPVLKPIKGTYVVLYNIRMGRLILMGKLLLLILHMYF